MKLSGTPARGRAAQRLDGQLEAEARPSEKERTRSIFFRVSAAILLFTSAAKLHTVLFSNLLLDTPNPVLWPIPNKDLMLSAAILEGAVAIGVLIAPLSTAWKAGVLFWLSSILLTYRLGLWWTGSTGTCPCLGTQLTTIGVPGDIQNGITLLFLLFIGTGSTALMTAHIRSNYKLTK